MSEILAENTQANNSDLPIQPTTSWIKLDRDERRRIEMFRQIINKANGVFAFAEKSQNLYCRVCQFEVPYRGLDTIIPDVNKHCETVEHTNAFAVFIHQQSEALKEALVSAITNNVFVQVAEGFVRCSFCDKVLNDSLSKLKQHLLSNEHQKAQVGVKPDTKAAHPNISMKLLYLVQEEPDLEFVINEEQKKVHCIKCNRLLPVQHCEILRHLQSKKHKGEKRKKPSEMAKNECQKPSPHQTENKQSRTMPILPILNQSKFKHSKKSKPKVMLISSTNSTLPLPLVEESNQREMVQVIGSLQSNLQPNFDNQSSDDQTVEIHVNNNIEIIDLIDD